MNTLTRKLEDLRLTVQRVLDAEVINAEEGAALLSAVDAAGTALAAGDVEAAHRCIERVALAAQALVRDDSIARADGYAVLRAANEVLRPGAGMGE